jgi:hypothetical protein
VRTPRPQARGTRRGGALRRGHDAGHRRGVGLPFDGQNNGYTPAIANVPAFIAELYPDHAYTQIFDSGDVYVFRLSR